MYIDNIDVLREKINSPKNEVISRLFSYISINARNFPGSYPHYLPFLYRVTGDAFYLKEAEKHLLHHFKTLRPKQLSQSFIYHPWTEAYPLSRWLVYYDWVYDDISAEAKAEIDSRLVEYAWSSLFPAIRIKPFYLRDNQTISLALASTVFGYFFGYKRGASLIAKELYTEGMSRVGNIIGAADPSGYTSEGALYLNIIASMMCHFISLLESSTGADWFNQVQDPSGARPRDQIEMAIRMFLPKGLGMPWNDSGYSRDLARMVIAYYTHRTNDPQYLHLLKSPVLLGRECNPGWGKDDSLWTLLWLPNKEIEIEKEYKSWTAKETAAHLISPDGDLTAFQYWNKSGFDHEIVRAHVHPNAIALHYKGIPFMVDGTFECLRYCIPETEYHTYGINTSGVTRTFGFGTTAGHNVLHFDSKEYHWPKEPQNGQMISFTDLGKLQRVVADVTDFYKEQCPDLQSVTRESILISPNAVLVRDRVVSGKPHEVTSRIHLRPLAMVMPNGIRVFTDDLGVMQMLPTEPTNYDIETIQHMGMDGVCHRVDRKDFGTKVTMGTLYLFDDITEELDCGLNEDDRWEAVADQYNLGERMGWENPDIFGRYDKQKIFEVKSANKCAEDVDWEGGWSNPSYYIKLSHYIKNADANFKRIEKLDPEMPDPCIHKLSPCFPAFMAADETLPRSQFWWYKTSYVGDGCPNVFLRLPTGLLGYIWINGEKVPYHALDGAQVTVCRELAHCVDLSQHNEKGKKYILIIKIAAIERTTNPWGVDPTVIEGWGGQFKRLRVGSLPWYSEPMESVLELSEGFLLHNNKQRVSHKVSDITTDAEIAYRNRDRSSIYLIAARNAKFNSLAFGEMILKAEFPVSLSYESNKITFDNYYRKGRVIYGDDDMQLRVIFNNNTVIRFFGKSKRTIVLRKFKGFCIVNGKHMTQMEDGTKDVVLELDPEAFRCFPQTWADNIFSKVEKTLMSLYGNEDDFASSMALKLNLPAEEWPVALAASYVIANHYKDFPVNRLVEAVKKERKEEIYAMTEEIWIGLGDYLPEVPKTDPVDPLLPVIGIRKPPKDSREYAVWRKRWRLKAEIIYAIANQMIDDATVFKALEEIAFDSDEFRAVVNACVTAFGRMNTPEAAEAVRGLLTKTNERTVLERIFAIQKINDRQEDQL